MALNFGVLPVRTSFTLSSDADFYQLLRTSDGSDFPATASVSIKWLDKTKAAVGTWTATISGTSALFREDAADVAVVLALAPIKGRVFYEDGAGGPELLLAEGDVRDISP